MTLAELRERCALVVEDADVAQHLFCVEDNGSATLMRAADLVRSIPLPEEKDPRELVEALKDICERLEHFQSSLSTEGDRQWVLSEVRAGRAALANWEKRNCQHDFQPNTTMDHFRCEKCGARPEKSDG